MAVITPEIKEFIKNNLGWITTVSKDGELDLGPKMSLFVLDDTHIAYHERTAGQHYENLKNGSPLVIAFANLEKKQGYRFRGNVVLHVDDDIYNEQVKVAEEKGTKKPAVIPVLEVTEIQDLASGPTAGKTIAKDFPDQRATRDFMRETAAMPYKFYSQETCIPGKDFGPYDENTFIPRFKKTESIKFFVSGGPGKQSQIWVPFPQVFKPVSKKIAE